MMTMADFDAMDATPAGSEAIGCITERGDDFHFDGSGNNSQITTDTDAPHDDGYVSPESMSSQFTPDNNDNSKSPSQSHLVDHNRIMNNLSSANNYNLPPPPPPPRPLSSSNANVNAYHHGGAYSESTSVLIQQQQQHHRHHQPLHHHQQQQQHHQLIREFPQALTDNQASSDIDIDAPSYDYSSQSTTIASQYTDPDQYTVSDAEEYDGHQHHQELLDQSFESLDGCEISLSSTSYSTATDHIFVGNSIANNNTNTNNNSSSNNVMVILQENEKNTTNRDSPLRVTKIVSESQSSETTTSTTKMDRFVKSSSSRLKGKKKTDRKKGASKSSLSSKSKSKSQKNDAKNNIPAETDSTPQISNSIHRKSLATTESSSSNLFLQMDDTEVGNHISFDDDHHHHQQNDDGFGKQSTDFSHESQLTGSTAAMTIDGVSSSALGLAAPGLRFHPANTAFANTNLSTTDEEEEEDEYYPSPIKANKKGIKKPQPPSSTTSSAEKKSPKSVIDGAATLTSFPRYQKTKTKHKSSRGFSHDSSYDESDMSMAEDDVTYGESIGYYDDHSAEMGGAAGRKGAGSGSKKNSGNNRDRYNSRNYHGGYSSPSGNSDDVRTGVRSIQKALFKQVSEPLDKFHDFITGNNLCVSFGKNALIGRLQDGCSDSSNVAGALIDDDEMEDYDYVDEEDDTLTGEDYDDDGDDDYSIEVSLKDSESMSMAESSRASSRYNHKASSSSAISAARQAKKKSNKKQPHGKKKQQQPRKKQTPKPIMEEEKQQQVQSTQKTKSRSRSAYSRGRSPTEKHGYNSDGESLTRSRSRRRAGGSGGSGSGSPRGTSLSLSTRNSGGAEDVVIMGTQGVNFHQHDNHGHDGPGQQQQHAESDNHSVAAESIVESIADSILSHDQAAWMAMTAASPQRQPRSGLDEANDVVNDSPRGDGRVDTSMDAMDENDGYVSEVTPDTANAVFLEENERQSSPFDMSDSGAIEGYFKKLLSVGIQLLLNDPPTHDQSENGGSPRLNRMGKMFLKFGTPSTSTGKYEHPYLLWTDGDSISYAFELLDVQSIRQPTEFELEIDYPFAIPDHGFFVSTAKSNANEQGNADGGLELLFEAVDELQMERVTTALRGIVSRLAKKIIMGENDWVVQMMLASSSSARGGQHLNDQQLQGMEELDLEGSSVPNAMADVTDHLVKKTALMKQAKTALMKQAHARRSRMRHGRR